MAPQTNDILDASVVPSGIDTNETFKDATVMAAALYPGATSYSGNHPMDCMEAQVKKKQVTFESNATDDTPDSSEDFHDIHFFDNSFEKVQNKRHFSLDWFGYTVASMTVIFLALIGYGLGSGLFLPPKNAGNPSSDQTTNGESNRNNLYSPRDDVQGRHDYKYSLVTLLGLPMMMERTSPQAQALEWLAYQDKPLFNPSVAEGSPEGQDQHMEILKQRYALTVWYFAQGGPTVWKTLNREESAGWMAYGAGVHECDWRGVDCDYSDGNTDQGTVVGMRLSSALGLVLSGTSLSTELGLLTSLRRIDFSGQRLKGSIPFEWASMTSLESLILSGNQLETSIPEWTGMSLENGGGWTNLELLALDGNGLYGSLPSSLSNLRQLKHLELQSNPRLEGNFDDVLFSAENGVLNGPGKNLEYLDISTTALEGTLPEITLPSIRFLRILHTPGLQGSLPTQIGTWSNLRTLSIQDAPKLKGSIPKEIGLLTNLETLGISECSSMSGELPTEIGLLGSSLKRINFTKTNLSGRLPVEWSNLVHLEEMILPRNDNLSGTIPTEYAQMASLKYLDFRRTNLSGEVSEDMCAVESIQEFRVDCSDDGTDGNVKCLCCLDCNSS